MRIEMLLQELKQNMLNNLKVFKTLLQMTYFAHVHPSPENISGVHAFCIEHQFIISKSTPTFEDRT